HVAPLTHAEQLLLAPGGVLSGHDAKPSCEVAAAAEGSAVTDSSHSCGGDQRAEAGDLTQTPAARVLIANSLDFVGNDFDLDLGRLPLLPQPIQQPAQTGTQVLFGVFNHGGQVLAELDGPCREDQAAFQQESPDLVDQCRATLHQSIAHAVHGLPI